MNLFNIPLINKTQDKLKTLSVCKTDITAVSLIDEKDEGNPNIQYTPSCTRVKRCGGCCGSNLFSCQPTQVETLNIPVIILQYIGTRTIKEKKMITVEQHVACKCQCTIKEQDCTPSQVYYVNECCCVCNNFEDQDKCYKENDKKIWDSDSCSCQCIEVQECTSGFKFNYNTCSCEPENE